MSVSTCCYFIAVNAATVPWLLLLVAIAAAATAAAAVAVAVAAATTLYIESIVVCRIYQCLYNFLCLVLARLLR